MTSIFFQYLFFFLILALLSAALLGWALYLLHSLTKVAHNALAQLVSLREDLRRPDEQMIVKLEESPSPSDAPFIRESPQWQNEEIEEEEDPAERWNPPSVKPLK